MKLTVKSFTNAIAICLALLSCASYADTTTKHDLTAEKLAKLQSVSQAQVSPNGEQIAFIRSVPRTIYIDKDGLNWSELYLVDDQGTERPYITGKVNVKKIQWSVDGTTLYFLAKMQGDKYTALYQIAINGGQAQKVLFLKGTNISNYALSQNNEKIALLAKKAKHKSIKNLHDLGFKAEIYEEELTNQYLYVTELKTSTKAITPTALPLQGYVSDVKFSPTGKSLLVKTQPSALIDDKYMKSQWHLVDIEKQTINTSFATEGKLGTAEFSYDGSYIAIHGAQDKHDPATGRLFLAETSTGKITNWLPNHLGHVTDFEWANKRNELFFSSNVGTESIVAKIKPSQNKYKHLVQAGKFIAGNLSISDSDKTVVLKAHTAQHPNEVFMLRGRKFSETRLTNSNKWLNDIKLAKQESITIKARDGVEVGGVLIYPLNHKEGQRYPLIMSVHGGPESHDKNGWLTTYSRPGQLAAANDYAVFYPNYRGSTGKGVAYSKLGQNDYAGKEFDDLIDLKDHLVNKGLVNEKKVGITGGSYGGYASAWGATKLTKHFAASVMFVGISNQLSKFGTTDISNEMHLVHARSYPWDKWQWYLERSPIYWVGQSETPLLIMHGKSDPRVHPSQSMELYRYMKVRGKTVRLVYYPGEGHGNKRAGAKYDYSLRLMRWMDNYLKYEDKAMPSHQLPHADNVKEVSK